MYRYQWEPFAGTQTPGMRLREEVFIEEQHFSHEFDELDQTALHLTVFDDAGIAVAVARLLPGPPESGCVRFGRVAVARAARGRSLGRLLMAELERKARELGYTRAVLGAQQRVEGFYARCGYQPTGERYEEDGCPHVEMEKQL
jgi:predicted GNAT family N-acyltransferase